MVPLGAGVSAAYCSCQLLERDAELPLKVPLVYTHRSVAYMFPSAFAGNSSVTSTDVGSIWKKLLRTGLDTLPFTALRKGAKTVTLPYPKGPGRFGAYRILVLVTRGRTAVRLPCWRAVTRLAVRARMSLLFAGAGEGASGEVMTDGTDGETVCWTEREVEGMEKESGE
eukprot:TRINITY_DN8210_c0_g3_i1.p1 TRINITY_DN8210_c0_g3~~TRINITY_DN8210_c0_g3_i1.p1  ORF type:complete len:169 (+),score=11.71 TRINITY_DN8210_c0_g3_i1:413-919(+)